MLCLMADKNSPYFGVLGEGVIWARGGVLFSLFQYVGIFYLMFWVFSSVLLCIQFCLPIWSLLFPLMTALRLPLYLLTQHHC